MDKQCLRRSQLLAFRRLHSGHHGENQTQALLEVIEYSIGKKLGYFIWIKVSPNQNYYTKTAT